jgi:hypothetical protein
MRWCPDPNVISDVAQNGCQTDENYESLYQTALSSVQTASDEQELTG